MTKRVVREYPSLKEASESNPRFNIQVIRRVCKNWEKGYSAYGFLWRYKDAEKAKAEYEATFNSYERWRCISDSSDLQISDHGRARNTRRKILYKQHNFLGYRAFSQYGMIHPYVAKLYVPNDNPVTKTIVDHIDRNRANNHYTNLRWVTSQENNEYSLAKSIQQCDANNGKIIREFKSTAEASVVLNIPYSTISACLNGRRKKAGGFKFQHYNTFTSSSR